MKIKDFSFDLPAELIAQTPSQERGDDRLLVIDRKSGEYIDSHMTDFPTFLQEGSLLIVNDTKVRKARVFGHSETGGTVEFLFTGAKEPDLWQAMVTKSKRQKEGKKFTFSDSAGNVWCTASIEGSNDALKLVRFDKNIDEDFFLACGHVPLPPYIKREDDFSDEKRYQTIFADQCGSMACPTAGLHFTDEIVNAIKAKGCEIEHITLHVGMGTFLPVRTENLEDHIMHTETYHVQPSVSEAVFAAKKEGRPVVAVGTTSVRTLESAFNPETGKINVGWGNTNLFITPGFKFNVVDQMLTNFHTPESTLLVLVSAFVSREKILSAYEHAVEERYRFFSYGDATFLK